MLDLPCHNRNIDGAVIIGLILFYAFIFPRLAYYFGWDKIEAPYLLAFALFILTEFIYVIAFSQFLHC